MPYSEAQNRAQKKYDAKMYDVLGVKLPKGTRDAIRGTGATVNRFINDAVMEKLENAKTQITETQNAKRTDSENAKTQNAPGSQNAPAENVKTQKLGSENAKAPVGDPGVEWFPVPAETVREMEQYGEPAEIIRDGIAAVLEEYRAGVR